MIIRLIQNIKYILSEKVSGILIGFEGSGGVKKKVNKGLEIQFSTERHFQFPIYH